MFTAWDDIREEVLRRIGRRQVNWRPRAEHVTAAAFNFVALEYHHPSLDKTSGAGEVVLNANAVFAALPDDWQHVIFVTLRDAVSNEFVANLRKERAGSIFMKQRFGGEDPEFYTVFENSLHFDNAPSVNRNIKVRYYARPVQPDFTTPTSFPLETVWIEPTIVKATELGFRATFRPDLANQQHEAFESEVAKIPTAVLVRDLLQQITTRDQDATVGHMGAR